MKITSNVVGNYGPSYLKPAQAAARTEATPQITAGNISTEEKKFFASLYPAQKDEVLNYQFYNAKGKITGTQVGSLFDRRG
jgi:hypothetical protein